MPEDYEAIGSYLDADIDNYIYQSDDMEALEQKLKDVCDNARYFITPVVKDSPSVINQILAEYPDYGDVSCALQTPEVTLQEMQGIFSNVDGGDYFFVQAEKDLSQALVGRVANYRAGACYTEYPSVNGNAALVLITQ